MEAVNSFAGMPQFMWENLFRLLNYLVPGVILALFAAYYQNRRKREIKIEGKLAVMRIDTYEKVLAQFYKAQSLQSATLKEEEKAKAILGYFTSETYHFQYPNAFQNEETFDAFYKCFQELQRDCQIYLDYSVSNQLRRSLDFYTICKNQLDAFADTEHVVDFGFSEEQSREHIDWVYILCGMLLFSHCTKAFVELDNAINRQLRNLSLSYRRCRVRRLFSDMLDRFLLFFDRKRNSSGLRRLLSLLVLKMSLSRDHRHWLKIMLEMSEIMRYVHFSDRIAPRDYFEKVKCPPKKEMDLYNKAYLAMVHGV